MKQIQEKWGFLWLSASNPLCSMGCIGCPLLPSISVDLEPLFWHHTKSCWSHSGWFSGGLKNRGFKRNSIGRFHCTPDTYSSHGTLNFIYLIYTSWRACPQIFQVILLITFFIFYKHWTHWAVYISSSANWLPKKCHSTSNEVSDSNGIVFVQITDSWAS